MGIFLLTEIKQHIAYSQVLKIVFGCRSDIFASFHIISLRFADNKGILQVLQIMPNSGW